MADAVLLCLDVIEDFDGFVRERITKHSEGHLCLDCGTTIKRAHHLRQHYYDRHFVENVTYVCPVCRKACPKRRSLYSHLVGVHKLKGIDLSKCTVPLDEIDDDEPVVE
jgi:hypothetical protein